MASRRRSRRRERKLPIQQLTILAICRFAEPIASTSLFPYLPEMIRSFGIPEDEVGKFAGFTAAVFSLSQAVMGIPWGRFSDLYGRKPAILLGLMSTMVTSLMWGFSKSLPMAIVARALAGAGNGNVGIIRTTVAEMVPFKELQPRAFSIMPLVWVVGSIFGPTIGGALANPLDVKPGEQIRNPTFLQRFPYSPPNIVSACFFTIGIIVGILFLEETLETLQNRRDYGLRLGDKLKALTRSHAMRLDDILHFRPSRPTDSESSPLLKDTETGHPKLHLKGPQPSPAPPTFHEVLTPQSLLNLLVYTLLALHNMAYDQLLPVYMQYPSLHSDSPYITKPSPSSSNPFKFAGGFALDHFRIGLIATGYGVAGMLIQFFVFPPIARRLGILYCLKWCVCVFPVTYFVMPFTALLPTQGSQVGACFAVMMVKCFCGIFAFPCSTILITNSASSLRVLGTLNGFATSTSALGRAAGPALGGAVFTVGVKAGYVVAPWWMFSAFAVVAAIPVFWLVEGEGFGGDDGEVSDEEEVEEVLGEEGLEGEADAAGKPGPVMMPNYLQAEEEEEAYGGLGGLLSRTTTMSSAALDDDSEAGTPVTGRSRQGSQVASGPVVSRRGSRRIMRRTSIPLGMGTEGISRRYSSNLGQSFGAAGSFHGQ
ncbi:hypothetical protein B0A55_05434 [Friedmanniomyces simplex]|uniref:Major facilitator superfamily (MFS) profile domain-containing protein n=1 Tax=Friedmanniomyces simplex TaxID=329884 RepID=A0A4U0XCW8_9PEZI|nr:hypothetical protein B0A55_05434 [Friedmanniomyces simplex]